MLYVGGTHVAFVLCMGMTQVMSPELMHRQEPQGQRGSLNLTATCCTCVMSLYNAGSVMGGRGKAGGSGSLNMA